VIGLTEDDFVRAGHVIQLGGAPNRVDLLTGIEGVSFDDVWEGRVPGPFGPLSVSYIGRSEFIRNKRAVGRLQDLADIKALET
jgi:hypothetical protein